MTLPKSILLIDGSSWLHRAFNALPALSTKSGEPTGALYGVLNMLRRLLADYQPNYLAVIFDAPGKTFRHEQFADYKAHRPPLDPLLIAQIEPLYACIRALGLPLLQISGVEADDVIGTLTHQATARGLPVLIVSGDKDLAQLVDEQVRMLDTMKNVVTDVAGVKQKFGVPPALIVDYLALVGDSSDNIPGVNGVGPVTAAKWLCKYGSLDALIANAAAISGKIGDKLRAGLEQLPLSRQLATLDCNVALPLAFEELQPAPPDVAALRALYERYEFRSWRRELATETVANTVPAPHVDLVEPETADPANYQLVLDQAAFDAWLERLQTAELFAFDTETTSLSYLNARIVGVSFAVHPGEAAYVPLAHDYPGAPDQLNREWVLEQLRPLLEDAERPKLGQHLKYDAHVLANHGIALRGIRHDTLLESYVLDSTAWHDLDSLAERHLGLRTIHFEDVAGKGAKQLSFNQVALEQAGPYAAEDADVTLRLHRCLWPRLEQEPGLRHLYEALEIPLIPVLLRMERIGVRVNAAALRQQSGELAQRLWALEQQAYALAGESFNLGSPKQLQMILFERMGLPTGKKTATGQISTAEEVLQELALDYPLPRLILEHRTLSKLKSTYTDRLPGQIHPHTGRVHTSYHQAVASTGRLSSSDPNLQNIPIRTLEGRRIRQAFVPEPGWMMLAADYSQIELRIMAHLSGDEGLLRAFAAGVDVHRATAAEVFGVALEAVSSDQRRSAKAINFGLIYGMSAFGLARQLGIERGAAQDYVNRYFARYPGVKAYMDDTRRQAAAVGYVETVFGRRLYLPDIRVRNPQLRQAAERAAINAPMQGTAADIIKRAMLAVDRWLQQSTFPARMIMQVHDELVFEVAGESVAEAGERIRAAMIAAAELRTPLEVDIGVGANWDEAH
ncbi:DNA polymerase I [Candidatus Contendibacter odensensis]|uniref:DNA polymerase I n=1 Tax=Candidatus Contendobacter odensis Run_B_J11 TaxID=1400861 RepID=A0A7U7G9W2_9GAMM|nr:DNA polymerase I [Candidatus Contendobacter odensis]CDH44434.1 DNA polymerase I [Candidatus Contendobacter odensis Run_B_J11]